MFDIHMHIIPGVDDGARDMECPNQCLKQLGQRGLGLSSRHLTVEDFIMRRLLW